MRALILTAFLASAAVPANAATLSWSGGGTTANWSDSGNWGFAGVPASGDTLVFPAAQPRLTNTNNLSGLVLSRLRFAGTGGGYAIYGNAFTLTAGIDATNTTGANTVNNNLTLSTSDLSVGVAGGVTFTLAGQIQGTVGLTKTGAGTLQLFGASGNTYTGNTFVQAGTCLLDKNSGVAVPQGTLTIGDTSGSSAVVRDINVGGNLGSTLAVVINEGGLLDLNGKSETVGAVTLSGGTVSTGAGRLQINGDVHALASATTATMSGAVLFSGGLRTIAVDANLTYSGLILAATVGDAGGGLQIIGTSPDYSVLFLQGSNSFTGPLTIDSLLVAATGPWALGTTNGGTFVTNNGTLWLSGIAITNETVTLAAGTELAGQYNSIWNGPIRLLGDADVVNRSSAGYTFDIQGAISGSGNLTVSSSAGTASTNRFSGPSANTYSGTTTVSNTTLLLAKIPSGGAIPGNLMVNDSTIVRLANHWQLNSPGKSLDLGLNSFLDLAGYNEWVGSVTVRGARIASGSGTFYLNGDIIVLPTPATNSLITGQLALWNAMHTITNVAGPGFFWPDLWITANISGGGTTNGLFKTGAGEILLSGSNSFTGWLTIHSGSIWAQSSHALGATNNPVVVDNGGSLFLSGFSDLGLKPLVLNGPGSGTLYGQGALVSETAVSSAGSITLATDSTITVYGNCLLTLSGAISGPGGFTKAGDGTLTLSGSSPNTYNGPTLVRDGLLQLAKSGVEAIANGTLTIGYGTDGADADVVRELGPNQINSTVPIVINSTGLLDLNNFSDYLGPLTFNSGHLSSGTGTAFLTGNVTVNLAPTDALIEGNIHLPATRTFDVAAGSMSPDLTVAAAVSGPGGILKIGAGEMSLNASNSYAGLTTVGAGSVDVRDSFSLGATNTGTVVNSGARLWLDHGVRVGLEPLTITGSGDYGGGALLSAYGSNTWAGAITLAGHTAVSVVGATCCLNLAGPISGIGNLTNTDVSEHFLFETSGTLILSGSAPNTFNGIVDTRAGTLLLNKSIPDAAIPHNLVVGGTVRLLGSFQIADAADVLVSSSGLLDLGTAGDYIDTLHGTGKVSFGTGGYLGVGLAGGTSQFDGAMTGVGYAGGWTLAKYGNGTFTVTGTNSYSAGQTHVFGGKLVVNGSQPQSPVVVNSGATLAGIGTVGNLLGNGTVAPGNSPGILTSSNVTFSASGALRVELDGLTLGSGYSQLNVNGTVALGNASLQVNMPIIGATNSNWTIINNDGTDAVTGTFAGLPEGGLLTAPNGAQFKITYRGGRGNNVVLTQISLPTQPLFTRIAKIRGGAIQLDGTGMSNLTYTVWANADLTTANWLNIGTATADASGDVIFTDPDAASLPARFYRFSWP